MGDRLPGLIDSAAFCRARRSQSGAVLGEHLPRLAEAGATTAGAVMWSATGSTGRDALGRLREFLEVGVAFTPVMPCARCLEPVTLTEIAAETRFRFAASEEQAAREDRDEVDCDVIAHDRHLDLGVLVEDEVLLALPMLATHEHCPSQL